MRFFDWRWWLGMRPKFATKPSGPYSITVVIPAYNEEKSIADTIRSVQAQTVPIERILLVDDSSTDATGTVGSVHGAEVVRTKANQGTKAMALNYVLDMVTSDLVVTIDADTILAPDAIEKILPYFGDEKTALVCGFVVPQRIRTLWECARFIEYLFGICIVKAGQNNIGAVIVCCGCFSVIRTQIWQQFGGFKPRTMAEDMDFTWEVQKEGYRVYCVQNSYCYPLDPSTARIFIAQLDRWYRGLFQCLAIHRFGKNKKLGFVIYGQLASVIISPIVIAVCVASVALYTKSILTTFAFWFLFDFMMMAIPCVIKGAMMGMLGKTLTSLPIYFIVMPVSLYVFWRSLWKEWIKKERLQVWVKGHEE